MILLSCRPWTMLCRPLREVACSGVEPFVTVSPGDAGDAAVPLLAFDARNRSPMVKFPLAAYRWQTVVRQHCLFQRKYGHSPVRPAFGNSSSEQWPSMSCYCWLMCMKDLRHDIPQMVKTHTRTHTNMEKKRQHKNMYKIETENPHIMPLRKGLL